MPVDIEYDEDMGNAPQPECLLNISRQEDLFKATERAIAYSTPEDGDANRAVMAIFAVERLFRRAPVEDPTRLAVIPFFTRCLDLATYLRPALELLLDNDLVEYDDDGEVVVMAGPTELQARADELVTQLKDDPALLVTHTHWDHFENLSPPCTAMYQWLENVNLQYLTEQTMDISMYTELSQVVGARALDAHRLAPDRQLRNVAGGPRGGELLAKLNAYFDTDYVPDYAKNRLAEFLYETRWPAPFDLEFTSMESYAHDLSGRSKWNKATRAEWPPLILSKVSRAVPRLETLSALLHSAAGKPAMLIKEMMTIGDAMLPGDTSQKIVFLKLTDIERELREDYDEMINTRREAGDSTGQIIKRLIALLPAPKEGDKEGGAAEGSETPHGLMAPKRGQVRKALADASFAALEAAWMDKLQGTQTAESTIEMLFECFEAETVLPKAILIATPGISLTSLTSESEFLLLLKDKMPAMRRHIGRALVYDEEEDEVPDGLATFELDEGQWQLTREVKWWEIDPINGIMLKMETKKIPRRRRASSTLMTSVRSTAPPPQSTWSAA